MIGSPKILFLFKAIEDYAGIDFLKYRLSGTRLFLYGTDTSTNMDMNGTIHVAIESGGSI